MSRHLAIGLALALVSQPGLAGGSHGAGGGGHGGGGHGGRGRGGGFSGGSHSGSSGHTHTGARSGSARVGSYYSAARFSRPGLSLAERRHPRPGTGRGRYFHYRGRYRPFYGSRFYGSLYFGWPYFYDGYYYDDTGYYPDYYHPPYPCCGYGYEDPGEDLAGGISRDRYRDDDNRDCGRLRLDVWPDDASIYVDGEFQGTARQVAALCLPPGRHRIEVVRPGFRPEERELEIGRGETGEVSVELQRP